MAVLPADVQKIIEYDTVLIPDVQPFIDDAVALLTDVIGATTLSAATFDRVTKYFAAHLVAVTDPRIQSEQVKNIQQAYQFRLSDGLGITHYGATAMLLDPSGKLAAWNKKVVNGVVKVQFFHAVPDNQ